jgi:hypothetical protein
MKHFVILLLFFSANLTMAKTDQLDSKKDNQDKKRNIAQFVDNEAIISGVSPNSIKVKPPIAKKIIASINSFGINPYRIASKYIKNNDCKDVLTPKMLEFQFAKETEDSLQYRVQLLCSKQNSPLNTFITIVGEISPYGDVLKVVTDTVNGI